MKLALLMLLTTACVLAQELREVRRICVEPLTGDRSAAQIRDMVIAALQHTRAFTITENPDRADALLKGSAEDLVFTDTFQTSESLTARAGAEGSIGRGSTSRRLPSISIGENESTRIAERKHEAVASVRLVNKDGDVIWSTTQESLGGKFRNASADVADKIARRLIEDYEKTRAK